MRRLDGLVYFVDENSVVADIGTDHGITAIKIYETKKPKKVIATDISENSLQKLRDKLEYLKYNIETVVTDGIKDLDKYDLDNIIISGMGGILISEIIEDGIEVAVKSKKLILQANNSLAILRRYLHESSFEIIDESICFESEKYYTTIVAKYKGNGVIRYCSDVEYEYGKILIDRKNPILKNQLEEIKSIYENIYSKIKENTSFESKRRIKELKLELEKIQGVLKCL